MIPALNVFSLGDPLGGNGFRMMQDLKANFVVVQAIGQLFWYFQARASTQEYHLPERSLLPGTDGIATAVIGYGVEQDGKIYCCVNCARAAVRTQLKGRL